MKKLIFSTLYSGSSGNAVYISYGEDAILIDAGKNNKALETALRAIGCDPESVRAVFVTHEHIDHVSALPVFSRRHRVPIHIMLPCAEAMQEIPETACVHENLFTETVGPFTVEAFYTPHDSACSVGYTIGVAGRKLGVATDMGILAKNVVTALQGCDAALIECNYDPDMLRTGVYPPWLKKRVGGPRGHLCNSDGALLAAILAYAGARNILLGHLSQENNTPDKALAAVMAEFERRGVSAGVTVASRECPTVLLREEL